MISLLENPAFWGAISTILGVVLGYIAKLTLGNKTTSLEERRLLTEEQFKLRQELREDMVMLKQENVELKKQVELLHGQIKSLQVYIKRLEKIIAENKIELKYNK